MCLYSVVKVSAKFVRTLEQVKTSTVSRIFSDLLSNSPKYSPKFSPGYEGTENIIMLYFLSEWIQLASLTAPLKVFPFSFAFEVMNHFFASDSPLVLIFRCDQILSWRVIGKMFSFVLEWTKEYGTESLYRVQPRAGKMHHVTELELQRS